MFDKLEKHNNKKISYVVSRRVEFIKNAIFSFFGLNKVNENYIFSGNYYFSTKK